MSHPSSQPTGTLRVRSREIFESKYVSYKVERGATYRANLMPLWTSVL